jgi:hypothetical protein
MIVIRRYIDSGEWVKMKYPRVDIAEPVENLDTNIEFYIIENNTPSYDAATEYLTHADITFTDNQHPEYSHLKVAIQNYNVNDIPQTETIIL